MKKGELLFSILFFLNFSCEQKYRIDTSNPTEINQLPLYPLPIAPSQNREVTLPLEGTTTVKPRVKIFLIVDNSSSMQPRQATLATGIGQMVDSLKGYNIDFLLLNTSAIYSNQYYASFNYLGPLQTNYFTRIPNSSGTLEFSSTFNIYDENWKFNFPRLPNHAYSHDFSTFNNFNTNSYRLSEVQTNAEFQQVKANLLAAISNTGTDGFDREQGLCTLGRTLIDRNSSATINNGVIEFQKTFSPTDKAAFVILSDENDQSYFGNSGNPSERCLSEIYYKIGPENEAAKYHFKIRSKVRRAHLTVHANANCFKDGIYTPCERSIYLDEFTLPAQVFQSNFNPTQCTGQNYDSFNKVSCPFPGSSALQTFSSYFPNDQNSSVTSCTISCIKNDWITTENRGIYARSDSLTGFESRNYCNNTTERTNMIADLITNHLPENQWEIDNTSCTKKVMPLEHPRQFTPIEPALNGQGKTVTQMFLNRLDEIFGTTGWIISAVVNTPSTINQCGDPNGRSLGTRYIELATAAGPTRGVVHPICNSNYTPALDKVKGFVENVSRLTYQANLNAGEKILAIKINRGTQSINLVLNTDYTISGNQFTFIQSSFDPQLGDSAVVTIGI